MGSSESKFFDFLCTLQSSDQVHGGSLPGEVEILRKMHSSESDISADLARTFNPNKHMPQSEFRDTPLHYAVRYEHKLFLDECLRCKGNPFLSNGRGQSAFHVACSSKRASQRVDKKRKELLHILLDHPLPSGSSNNVSNTHGKGEGGADLRDMIERSWRYHPAVSLQDKEKNTPLHIAAVSGLFGCVELLLAHGSDLFAKNVFGKTPSDLAEEGKQIIILKLMESKMVFVNSTEKSMDDSELSFRARTLTMDSNSEDLRRLQMDMIESLGKELNIQNFEAEALLIHNNWSEEFVKEAWKEDKVKALKEAGIEGLLTANNNHIQKVRNPTLSFGKDFFECEICLLECTNEYRVRGLRCEHCFCSSCLSEFVGTSVKDGKTQLKCPGQSCSNLIPPNVVEKGLPDDMKEKYKRFGLQAYVDGSNNTKWCPYQGCGKVVALPPGTCVAVTAEVNVECEDGHTFCWLCHEEPGHEPLPCELWKEWLSVIEEIQDGEVSLTKTMKAEANGLYWIAENTKPCPKCRIPIQKNFGCNHMTCVKCAHEFCWTCLDPWNKHNRSTGGYFQCNRVTEIMAANQRLSEMQKEQEKKAEEITDDLKKARKRKFDMLHKKFNSHLESMALERNHLAKSQKKTKEMAKLVSVLDSRVSKVAKATGCYVDTNTSQLQTDDNFLYLVMGVLIRTRPILAASYALTFFLDQGDQSRSCMEEHSTMQGRIEASEEELAKLITESHLKATRTEIVEAAKSLVHLCNNYIKMFKPIANNLIKREEENSTESLEEEEFYSLTLETDPEIANVFLRLLMFNLRLAEDIPRDNIPPQPQHSPQ